MSLAVLLLVILMPPKSKRQKQLIEAAKRAREALRNENLPQESAEQPDNSATVEEQPVPAPEEKNLFCYRDN